MESSRSITRDNNESGTANSHTRATAAAQQILCTGPRGPYEPRQRPAAATSPNDAIRVLAAATPAHADGPRADRTPRYAKCVLAGDMAANTLAQRAGVQQPMPYNGRYYEPQPQPPAKMSDVLVSGRKTRPTTSLVRSVSRPSARQSHAYNMANASDAYSIRSGSSCGSTCTATSCSGSDSSASAGNPNLPYPGFPELSLNYLTQTMRPRNWCLLLITNPWFERVSILVILFNCITLGMYQPCVDDECVTNRCKILQVSAPPFGPARPFVL